ncbi:MAG: 50S ribosomal L9 C-terminal domain-containing protein, partial [Acutalibacteraceae bacterium]|nr:50S ribosomal L9 C-terminal domain-containing protein [Acutalibacteraceae bacterium]
YNNVITLNGNKGYAMEIATEIKNNLGIDIDRKKMQVADIKNFGEYTAEIKLHIGVVAKINVKVTE